MVALPSILSLWVGFPPGRLRCLVPAAPCSSCRDASTRPWEAWSGLCGDEGGGGSGPSSPPSCPIATLKNRKGEGTVDSPLPPLEFGHQTSLAVALDRGAKHRAGTPARVGFCLITERPFFDSSFRRNRNLLCYPELHLK